MGRRSRIRAIKGVQKAIRDEFGSDLLSPEKPVVLDKPQDVQSGTVNVDSWTFCGGNTSKRDGRASLYVRVDRGRNSTSTSLRLVVPQHGTFSLRQTDAESQGHADEQLDGEYGPSSQVVAADGALKLTRIQALTTWVIEFDGFLRVNSSEHPRLQSRVGHLVHVVFKYRWKRMTDVCLSAEFDSPAALLAEYELTAGVLVDEPALLSLIPERRVSSFGHIMGQSSVILPSESVALRHQLSVRGLYRHVYSVGSAVSVSLSAQVHGVLEFGQSFALRVVGNDIVTGYMTCPYGILRRMIVSANASAIGEVLDSDGGDHDHDWEITFESEKYAGFDGVGAGQSHETHTLVIKGGSGGGGGGMESVRLSLDGIGGVGFCERVDLSLPASASRASTHTHSLIQSLDATATATPDVVGGKGAQLAELCSVGAGAGTSGLFSTSDAVCLTTYAHAQAVEECPALRSAIDAVAESGSGPGSGGASALGDLEVLCKAVRDAYALPEAMPDAVRAAVARACESEPLVGRVLAVRSSGVNEDAKGASSAGQMETVLGIKASDAERVVSAVVECWQSQFTTRAVVYRNLHKQSHTVGMGVVIQVLVQSVVSGVAFTLNPVSGCETEVAISANYGLGETVVSGSVEPDSIIAGDGSIAVTVGEKKEKLVYSDLCETETVPVPDEDRARCCLSDAQIKQLVLACRAVEARWCTPCDIEWAFGGDSLVILQARPVTAFPGQTYIDREKIEWVDHWDLVHEFDTPLQSDHEWLTTSNISEMAPGACTPLMRSMYGPGIDYGTGTNVWRTGLLPPRVTLDRSIFTCYVGNHPFMNLTASGGVFGYIAGTSLESLSFTILGRIDDEWCADNDVIGKNGSPSGLWEKFKFTKRFYSWLFTAGPREIKAMQHKLESVKRIGTGTDTETALDLWNTLDADAMAYHDAWASHIAYSARSGMWAAVFMSMLNPKMELITADHYADMAALMGRSGGTVGVEVESANVPEEMERLAAVCLEANPDFAALLPADALAWLEGEAVYQQFLARHGHRCIREAEFRTPAWFEAPLDLVKAVQGIANHSGTGTATVTTKRDTNQYTGMEMPVLRTPIPNSTKKTIKRLLPRARRGVGEREFGKSVCVKHQHLYKVAYRELGEKMARQGLIGDADLVYFLAHREIGIVLRGHGHGHGSGSGAEAEAEAEARTLVTRAEARRRVYEEQYALEFDEFGSGLPLAIGDSVYGSVDLKTGVCASTGDVDADADADVDQSASTSVKRLTGMPMCLGTTEARARVCITAEDAEGLVRGEVLVCQRTDVGWSPFFPIVSGLVTELGGLLSHGAVVAREFGIPCVVAVKRACRVVKTGDLVRVDGERGIVEIIE